jgi:hypothetical protein
MFLRLDPMCGADTGCSRSRNWSLRPRRVLPGTRGSLSACAACLLFRHEVNDQIVELAYREMHSSRNAKAVGNRAYSKLMSNYAFKPTAGEVCRSNQPLLAGGGLTRR